MKRCFREEGDTDEQTVHCSRVLAVLEGEKKVLAGTHRFHHAASGSFDHSHRRQCSGAIYLRVILKRLLKFLFLLNGGPPFNSLHLYK